MSDDLVKELRFWNGGHKSDEKMAKAADRIEQLQKEVSTARRTSNYWKMEHLEGNKRIEQLEAALQKYAEDEYNGYNADGNYARAALGEKKDD